MRLAAGGLTALAVAGAAQAEPVGGTGWDIRTQPGSFDSPPCVVRIAGPDVSTSILQNRDGRAVLILARPDWRLKAAEAQITLSIDGGPPLKLEGNLLGNLVLPEILEPALIERLSQARRLEWTMPHGQFRGDVAGFGQAWAALQACNAKVAAKPKA